MKDNLVILGSTGSIGTQSLRVAKNLGLRINALSANKNIKLLALQAREFCPRFVAIGDKELYSDLKVLLGDTNIKIEAGEDAICELAQQETELVINAIVGFKGLSATLACIAANNTIALANKESLVAAGKLVLDRASKNNVKIIPVDSEHSAIFQCLNGEDNNKIKKILLTASGGPFFGKSKNDLESVSIEQALNHPNWSMGKKITIDSATMMNKGLELIEAVHLFGVEPCDVEILVHRQSIVHSAVEFYDGAVIAQLGAPDMCIPIQYAITYPERVYGPSKRLSLFQVGALTFDRADDDTFLCLKAAKEAIARGGLWPCVINGANEQAVELFLAGKISFNMIGTLVYNSLSMENIKIEYSINDVYEADIGARDWVLKNL